MFLKQMSPIISMMHQHKKTNNHQKQSTANCSFKVGSKSSTNESITTKIMVSIFLKPRSLLPQKLANQRNKSFQSLILLAALVNLLLFFINLTPNAQAMQINSQTNLRPPTFINDMNLFEVKENTPINESIYNLKAQLDNDNDDEKSSNLITRIVYGIEGTQLFSVNKTSGQVRVAQTIDRELTSDSISFQVTATAYTLIGQKLQYGPPTKLDITVFIVDQNDNPPKIERVKISRNDLNSIQLNNKQTTSIQGNPIVRLNLSESLPIGSVVVDLIEAVDVDKASSNPLSSICVDCGPEFKLQSTTDSLLNDKLNLSIILNDQLVHIPKNNTRHLQVIVTDGKFNSSLIFEITILDVQNKPPQFIGSTTCIVNENLPIDKTIMTMQAIDGDAIGFDEDASLVTKNENTRVGRQILYDLLNQNGQTFEGGDFKLHPLTGQLQVSNRIDREAYLSINGILTLRVRARELTVDAEKVVKVDDLYDSILDKLAPFVDQSAEATNEVDITVILVDVNDNEPHWLNSSELLAVDMNKSPFWYSSLPHDRDTGRIYQVFVKENSLVGSPITTKNEMFVYDLDNGENANFNISIIDQFGLFDVEPKQVSGFALVTLKLANNFQNSKRSKLLDYENPNERKFIITLVATETSTKERFSSKAQVHISVLDVNDNAPEFKETAYHANIREDVLPGKSVVLVQATDKDEISKQLTYSLHGRSAYLFDINRQSGVVSVAKCESHQRNHNHQPAKQCIDYEVQRSHHLMVEVSDGELSSKVSLTIFIDDAPDNPPVFTLPVVDVVIEEGSDQLNPPIKIEATDVDQSSVLTYSIVEGNFEGLFSINNGTGELQLTRPIRIPHDDLTNNDGDYRQHQLNKMTLIIQVTDGVYTTNGTIRIDVLDANDNAPKFLHSHYTAEINESVSPGQSVVSVSAIDADRGSNAKVSYKIQRGSFGQFSIDENSGLIVIAQEAQEFDTSKRDHYSLEVVAYDHGIVSKSSSVLVDIRVSDTIRRAPEFTPQIQRVSVRENTLNNTIIHHMVVTTPQNSAQNQEQNFGSEVGDFMLVFEPGPIVALDKNSQPVAASERLESMFSVSTNTGDVMVNSGLDHDFAAYINLTIFVSSKQVMNASLLGEASQEEYNPRSVGYIIINVIDDNSNPPMFASPWSPHQPELFFQMLEELPINSTLTQLVAYDVDSKISHFKIDPPNEYFELSSPQSGVIVNKKLIDYDALMSQTFLTPGAHRLLSNHTNPASVSMGNNIIQFNVHAYDSGDPQLSAKATVSVEILPANDHDCRFEQSVYEVRMRENTAADTLVAQVRAIDLDYGEHHNSIKYQLIGEHSDYFNIDSKTGVITVSSRGSVALDRERLSQSSLALTVIGRDDTTMQPLASKTNQKLIPLSRTCSSTVKVFVDDVNDNPPLFVQKLYEVTAYDTDIIDVPLIKLIIRDDDSSSNQVATTTKSSASLPMTTFRIISGNLNDMFNITNTGLLYATKPFNSSLVSTNHQIQLRVQVRQHSSSTQSQNLFTDECLVNINFVKINRHGPVFSDSLKQQIFVEENAKPGTQITTIKCTDPDFSSKTGIRIVEMDENNSNSVKQSSPMRYWIKENGLNLMETNEFKLDPISGKLITRIALDRESQEYYQLVVACEDNGKPQSLENVMPLFIVVRDLDDNKPEFLVANQLEPSTNSMQARNSRPTISFSIEENQSRGLPVGELHAIDRDIENLFPIQYCLIEGNEYQEFSLDRNTGTLFTNQSLNREKQSVYDLLIKVINDGTNCEDYMIGGTGFDQSRKESAQNQSSISSNEAAEKQQRSSNQQSLIDSSFINVKVNVLDINDNAPIFKRPIYRAGVHHRSFMNSLVTQVNAFDPDSGLNGTLSYKISEILMYKTNINLASSTSRARYDVTSEQQPISKPIKLIQFPFRIDQQGNLYTQQLLTQYQLTSMFVVFIEATEQADPWRTARTKLEIYVYETNSQLKISLKLHPRFVDAYRPEIESILSNATKYTAIINRARSYFEPSSSNNQATIRTTPKSIQITSSSLDNTNNNNINNINNPSILYKTDLLASNDEQNLSNIHLIFVDNFRIVNPNLVMEKFDLTSAQLFMPQILTQLSANNNNNNPILKDKSSKSIKESPHQTNEQQQQLQFNEVSSLIDKIALASTVQSAEFHSTIGTLAGVDWLENPSVLYTTLTILLLVIGFVIFLFGCCCTSRIKDHIVKNAMKKLVKQQQMQAKINEQVLAATNQANLNNQEYILQQGGFMSSFDATKGCITNNNENMSILQQAAIGLDEYIDPNYTTLNSGLVNRGAHYYDTTEIEQQQAMAVAKGGGVAIDETKGTSKQLINNNSPQTISDDIDVDDDSHNNNNNNNNNYNKNNGPHQAIDKSKLLNGNGTAPLNNIHRQRQQVPN